MPKHAATRSHEARPPPASGGRTTKTLSAIAAVITALGARLPLAGTPGSPITTGR